MSLTAPLRLLDKPIQFIIGKTRLFFVLNPMFIRSGFRFPISSVHEALPWLTYFNPLD